MESKSFLTQLLLFIGLIIANQADTQNAIVTSPVDTIALLSEIVQLNCSVSETSGPNVYWFNSGTFPITTDKTPKYGKADKYNITGGELEYNLVIYDITLEDEDFYKCARDPYEVVANLYVVANKSECSVQKNVIITGEEVEFYCTIDLNNDAPGDLVWYADNIEYARSSNRPSTWTATLNKTHNGVEFYCRFEHYTLSPKQWDSTACEENIIIAVQYSPDVSIEDISNWRVIQGDKYMAKCVIDANPLGIIEWFQPSGNSISDADLILDNVERWNEGKYTCRGTNTLYTNETRFDSETIYLSVEFEPELTTVITGNYASDMGEVVEGGSMQILCLVNESNPSADSVQWHTFLSDSQWLNLTDVKREQSGNYTCEARNTFWNNKTGIGFVSVAVTVQYFPEITVSNSTEWTAVEKRNYLSVCKVSANPTANVEWKYKGQTVGNGELLELTDVHRTMDGEYICHANNMLWNGQHRMNTGSIHLDVQYPPTVEISLKTVFEVGDNVTLNCSVVEANPMTDNITWFRNDQAVHYSAVYTLYNITRDDKGEYECRATNIYFDNSMGIGSNTTTLIIHHEPAVVISSHNNGKVIEGHDYTATCSADAEPQATMTWIYPDGTEFNNGNLLLSAIDINSNGTYTCVAENQLGKDMKSIYVDVQYPPTVFVVPDLTCEESDTVTLTCIVTDSNPPVETIQWFKNDGLVHSDGTYTFDNITRNNAGEYNCTATNTYFDDSLGVGSHITNIYVQYKPAVVISSHNNGKVIEGHDYTATCSADAEPQATITWIYPDGTEFNNGNLLLSAIDRYSNGTYTCVAENQFENGKKESDRESIYVDIQYPPTVSIEPDITCKEGDTVTLVCNVTNSNPDVDTIKWLMNGVPVHSDGLYTFDRINRNNSGQYICTATNTYFDGSSGVDNSITNIDVHYQPIIKGLIETEFNVGQDVDLVCTIDANPHIKEETISWQKVNGDSITKNVVISSPDGNIVNTTLTINDVTENDSGQYKCLAKSEFDDVDHVIILKVTSTNTGAKKGGTNGILTWQISIIIVGAVVLIIIIAVLSFLISRTGKAKPKDLSNNNALIAGFPTSGDTVVENEYFDNPFTETSLTATNTVEDIEERNGKRPPSAETPTSSDEVSLKKGSQSDGKEILYTTVTFEKDSDKYDQPQTKPAEETVDYATVVF